MLRKKMKKGSVLAGNVLVSLLIAIAIVVVVFIFLTLIISNWDGAKKAAESSFNQLKLSVAAADQGATGSYFLFDGKKDELNFYLAYFGTKNTFDGAGKSFVYLGKEGNKICVCYEEKKQMFCVYCMNLAYPARLDGKEGPWAALSDQQIEIKKVGELYEFTIKK